VANLGGSHSAVVGVGSVDLPVKRSPNLSGRRSHGILALSHVLHVPSSICNLIGQPILEDHDINLGFGQSKSRGTILDLQGKPVAYFNPDARLLEIKLSGPPVGPRGGPSPFNPSVAYVLTVDWPASEREKWAVSRSRQTEREPRTEPELQPPLAPEEKRWLKENWNGEFSFLQSYGLSIYKEDNRSEGRAILRGIMKGEEDSESDEQSPDRECEMEGPETDNFDDGDEALGDPASHLADYHFTDEELDFIKAEYGNTLNFMFTFGLKFYKPGDGEEAKAIVRALMSEDSDEDSDDHDRDKGLDTMPDTEMGGH
jgi:hypothetical protein